MIFVTVGTHEQPFDRLVKYVDLLKGENVIQEEIIIQAGFTTYEPKFCAFSKLYPYPEMQELIKRARIVITHGGPSSFIIPLQIGKIPIVVPRQKQFGEHVNDHQMDFSRAVVGKYKNIIMIEKIDDLKKTIVNYEDIIKKMPAGINSNNDIFNKRFNGLVMDLLKNEKERH